MVFLNVEHVALEHRPLSSLPNHIQLEESILNKNSLQQPSCQIIMHAKTSIRGNKADMRVCEFRACLNTGMYMHSTCNTIRYSPSQGSRVRHRVMAGTHQKILQHQRPLYNFSRQVEQQVDAHAGGAAYHSKYGRCHRMKPASCSCAEFQLARLEQQRTTFFLFT